MNGKQFNAICENFGDENNPDTSPLESISITEGKASVLVDWEAEDGSYGSAAFGKDGKEIESSTRV